MARRERLGITVRALSAPGEEDAEALGRARWVEVAQALEQLGAQTYELPRRIDGLDPGEVEASVVEVLGLFRVGTC